MGRDSLEKMLDCQDRGTQMQQRHSPAIPEQDISTVMHDIGKGKQGIFLNSQVSAHCWEDLGLNLVVWSFLLLTLTQLF